MTPEQAAEILTMLKAAYPHGDASLDRQQASARDAVYRSTLLTWGVASAQEAVRSCLLIHRFYPTIAELHAAYTAAARSKPERSRAGLPAAGNSTASPEEIRAACAEAIAKVTASAGFDTSAAKATRRAGPAPAATPDEELDMQRATIERANRADAKGQD